ncbi:E3 ubiquitin-protein ligase RNF34-like [Patiria miniata]|uniref:RING-type domain-containing protein n=1 Tax=Patiria miniata TaxID=46514 RepID=A0A913ZTE6_PATMI|nr:E3 ubiquitin-protein ligase RNF34-like [Patiria miniata]XP_038054715.1 E3 ubiquitin-protein ligase RNF34-like [Patiria miniata]
MGSAAGKQAQGSEAFSGTISQTTSSRPQSRTQQTPQGRSHSTPQSRQPDISQGRQPKAPTGRSHSKPQSRQPNAPRASSQDPGHSSRNLSFISLDEDEEVSMVCESCSANFTIFKRKNRCLDCSKLFCTNCMRKEPRKCCKICHMFMGSKDRSQLMQFKVKDLRQYLAARDINTVACREKGELVDLVVQYLATRNGGAFMVTVNNLEDASEPTSTTPTTSQPETSHVGSGRTDSQGPRAQSGDAAVQASQEQLNRNHDAPDIGVTRNTWVEGSSSSESETERSPIASFSSPEEEPSSATTTPPEQSKQPPVRHRTSISDLKTIDDIADLSVRQLKEILTLNFINYKGCVERWELEERVRRLYSEKEGYKSKEQASAVASTDSNEPKPATLEHDEIEICKICMDSPIDCVLLECGHMVTCTKCGKQLAECPMCRQYIIRAVHVFRS